MPDADRFLCTRYSSYTSLPAVATAHLCWRGLCFSSQIQAWSIAAQVHTNLCIFSRNATAPSSRQGVCFKESDLIWCVMESASLQIAKDWYVWVSVCVCVFVHCERWVYIRFTWIWAYRPSIKGSKLLFPVIKATKNQTSQGNRFHCMQMEWKREGMIQFCQLYQNAWNKRYEHGIFRAPIKYLFEGLKDVTLFLSAGFLSWSIFTSTEERKEEGEGRRWYVGEIYDEIVCPNCSRTYKAHYDEVNPILRWILLRGPFFLI